MNQTCTGHRARVAAWLFVLLSLVVGSARAAPPAPVVVAPSNGASLVQPITLDWNPVVDPGGPIGSYTWQVSTSSSFTNIILAGFTNNLSDAIPTATEDKVSGLPNGTYFWRVKGTQIVGGVQFAVDTPWSAVRSFTVTGLGAAPGVPTITTPTTGTSFHVREFFDVEWSPVPGAHYYLLEVDDQPNFSYPLTLTTNSLNFGTRFEAGWGNAIPNIYYRVRAVSVDNVRGLPSATVNVHISNAAPVPPAPTLLAPAPNATVTVPFTFDWTDTANPQIVGYDLDVDTDPSFSGSFGVLLLQGVSRSDWTIMSDLPPGKYFWRVRALHGDAFGPWTTGRPITVAAPPPAPPDMDLFAIIAEPGNGYGGNSTQARVLLNKPAPAGGALVTLASDMPQAEVPATVFIPQGKTDAIAAPVTTGPVPVNGIIGTLRAAYANRWQMSSLGVLPLLYGTGLSQEAVVGGTSFTGTVTLQSGAPPGGATIRLISSDTSLVRVPATVFIPAGGTDATFTALTSAVSVPTRVVIETGTDVEGYRAPQAWILLTPPGTPAPAPSLSTLTLNPPNVLGEGTSTATVTLTSPAPAGGAQVWLNGSMEGTVVTPPNVTVPAGALSADFTINAPQVNTPHWIMIQARYGTSGGSQAKLLRVDPGPPGAPVLLAMGTNGQDVIGGNSIRGTVALVTPAAPGGGAVSLTSDNPSVAQVPAEVSIAAGNSTNSFNITTTPISIGTTVRIDASAGGVTRSAFVNVAPDPNAPPLLQSLAFNPPSVVGGTNATGIVTLRTPAPAGGLTVTLSTSNLAVARPPGIVLVPAGQTSATFSVTTFAVTTDTAVSINALFDTTRTAVLTVTRAGAPAASLSSVSVSPTSVVGGNTSQGTVRLSSGAPSGGAVVSLGSSNPGVVGVPATVTVPAGATSATFSATTTAVSANTSVTLTASYNSVNRTATLTVTPVPPPASLSSLGLSPAAVTGGGNSTGTVTLTSAAPSGGAVVSLSSSNTATATVPASVTVAAGATSATFTASTQSVSSSTAVTVTATYNAVSRNATLTVNPASGGSLPAPSLSSPANDARFSPGQNITFDWGDVAGAANYTIQIDDADTFPSPLIVGQTVTASQVSSNTLPTKRMWWRVRANAADGTPGAWSSVRRFEIKN